MLPLGTEAPFFSLPDVTSNEYITRPDANQFIATVIFFICNHCPYVKHIEDELVKLANEYIQKNTRFIAINSNDIESHPDDSPKHMQETAKNHNYPFPYLFDETQEVAKSYQAACTPDFFIFDSNLILVYRGQLDDSRPGNNLSVNGYSIRTAIDQLMNNQPISINQKPSMGCNIKWKK